MSFHLPSCSIAKKQQEHLAPITNSTVQSSSNLNDASASSDNAKIMHPPARGNPYVKRKNPISFVDTTNQNSRSSGEKKLCAPMIINQSSRIVGNSVPSASNLGAYIVPMPTVDPNATFSQAFSNIDRCNDSNTHAESLQAEQVSFEQEQSSGHSSRENQMSLQTHVLHVSNRQRGNGILRYIRNVPFTFSDIVPDFITSPNRCQLFLSFKYHCLHTTYIHRRISELRSDFDLRVLLCLVDVDDNASILFSLNKLCVVNNMTLMLAWSEEECARYLETFKTLENNNGSIIQRREQTTFVDQITDTLTSIKSVNKTDAVQLMGHCTSILGIARTSIDQLGLIPGLGPKKVRRVYDAFHKPFTKRVRRESDDQNGESGQAELVNEIKYGADEEGSIQAVTENESKDDAEEGDSGKEVTGESSGHIDEGYPTMQKGINNTSYKGI